MEILDLSIKDGAVTVAWRALNNEGALEHNRVASIEPARPELYENMNALTPFFQEFDGLTAETTSHMTVVSISIRYDRKSGLPSVKMKALLAVPSAVAKFVTIDTLRIKSGGSPGGQKHSRMH